MAIQLIEKDGGKVLVVDICGKLAKEDYANFVPAFERCARQHPKLRVLLDMTHFEGWEAGALWEEIQFDLKHFGEMSRLAALGDKKWHHALASFGKPFTKATIRYFDQSDAAGAWQWLEEG